MELDNFSSFPFEGIGQERGRGKHLVLYDILTKFDRSVTLQKNPGYGLITTLSPSCRDHSLLRLRLTVEEEKGTPHAFPAVCEVVPQAKESNRLLYSNLYLPTDSLIVFKYTKKKEISLNSVGLTLCISHAKIPA